MINRAFYLEIDDGEKAVVEHDTDKNDYRVFIEKQDGTIVKKKSDWSKLKDDFYLEKGVFSLGLNSDFYDYLKIDACLRPLFRDYLGKMGKVKEKEEGFIDFYKQNPVKVEDFEGSHKEVIKQAKLKTIKIDNYIDNATSLYEQQPYFFDKNGIWWKWNKYKWEITDETEMSQTLDECLGFLGQTISSGIKNNHLEAMRWIGRKNKPKEAKNHWIQFKDKAYSLTKKVFYEVKPNYFFTNPIEWDVGESEETPMLDKLFTEWVGDKYKQDLYEILAYCCFPAYPIQTIICLIGSGRNGKSSFLKVLSRFIGKANCCSTELDLITGNNSSKFETSKLYKKLVCIMGETNFGIMSKSSMIKKLTGGDMIGFEMKGKTPFDDYNYAKIIVASNSLPSSQDTSEGFYRRWVIIDFPNQFPEGKDICLDIPEQEFNNLSRKIINILPSLLARGSFTNQGTIQERTFKYISSSNPFPIFVKNCCEVNEDYFVATSELYTAYIHYLNINKKRRVKRNEYKEALENEGFWEDKTNKSVGKDVEGYNIFKSSNWVLGLKLQENWKENIHCDDCDDCALKPYQKNSYGEQLEKSSQSSQLAQFDQKVPKIPLNSTNNIEIENQQSQTIQPNIDITPLNTIKTPISQPIFLNLKDVETTLFSILAEKKTIEINEFLQIYPKEYHVAINQYLEQQKLIGEIYEPRSGFISML